MIKAGTCHCEAAPRRLSPTEALRGVGEAEVKESTELEVAPEKLEKKNIFMGDFKNWTHKTGRKDRGTEPDAQERNYT